MPTGHVDTMTGGARMSRIFHRQASARYPRIVAGSGPYLFDDQGRRWLDACGGAAVSCLGHGHPAIVEAIERQARRVAYAHTSFFTTDVAEALADTLVAGAPEGISHAYFVSGGSEAMEAALKMARQYHLERGEPGRTLFVARRQSYHGNTLGALAVGGNAARRRQYAPLLMATEQVSPCYAYRDQLPGESAAAYGERLRGGEALGGADWPQVLGWLETALSADPGARDVESRRELIQLARTAATLDANAVSSE